MSTRSLPENAQCNLTQMLFPLLMPILSAPGHLANTVVFEDINVVPMYANRVLNHQDVVVKGSNIVSVAPHRNTVWNASVKIVDGKGKFLIPGLNDLHIHTSFGDEQQLQLYLAYGVTSVLNLNGSKESLAWRERIKRGDLAGPNFYTAGQIITGDPPTNTTHLIVHNASEAKTAVEEQVREGYDFIKPYSALSSEAYDSLRATAARLGIRTVGHVSWNVGVEKTLRSRPYAIAHIEELYRYFVDRHKKLPADTRPDERKLSSLAQLVVSNDVKIVTTLSSNVNILEQAKVLNRLLNEPQMRFVPMSYRIACQTQDPYANRGASWVLQNEIMVPFLFKIVAQLNKAGATLVTGSDATNPIQVPGYSLHRELELLVAAGLSPYESLRAATRNSADFLGRRAGQVRSGYAADLVMLGANPLTRIANVRSIEGVMVRGTWLSKDKLKRLKGELAAHMLSQ